MDELISTEEAGRILGCGRARVRVMIQEGRLTAFKQRTKGEERPFRYRLLRSEVEAISERWRLRKPSHNKVLPEGKEQSG